LKFKKLKTKILLIS